MVKISENNQTKIIDTILKHVKGFSMILAIIGSILIVLGLCEVLRIPEAFYCGAGLLGFSVFYLISETIIKIIKLKKIK